MRADQPDDQQSMLMCCNRRRLRLWAITVVSGDQWRDEEVAAHVAHAGTHGHPGIKVYPGAVFPLINNKEEIQRWEKLYGVVSYQGAWNEHKIRSSSGATLTGAWNSGVYRGPFEVPNPLPEGNPALKPETEDAAHFLIRMVHQYPHEVTILCRRAANKFWRRPSAWTQNFQSWRRRLVVMGGSIAPVLPMNWHKRIAASLISGGIRRRGTSCCVRRGQRLR